MFIKLLLQVKTIYSNLPVAIGGGGGFGVGTGSTMRLKMGSKW